MKKLALLLPLTFALITACTSTPVPATLNTLTLGGVSGPLQISSAAKLSVTATDMNGNPYSGTPTFTSSDPNVIAVATDGTLSVLHLSTVPVALSVSEDGKTASLQATTYGLDVTGGNYQTSNSKPGAPGITFIAAFRDAAGAATPTDLKYTLLGPSGFNAGLPLSSSVLAGSTVRFYTSFSDPTLPLVSGRYDAVAVVGNVTYKKTMTLDALSLQPLPSAVTASVTGSGYTAAGALPGGACTFLTVYTSAVQLASSPCLVTLPTSGTWGAALPGGAASYGAFALSYSSRFGAPFPDQFNRAFSFLGTLSLP